MSKQNNAHHDQKQKANKTFVWIAGILTSVVTGLIVSWMVSHGIARVAGIPVVALLVVWAFVINWIALAPAFLTHTEKCFDLTGATNYITAMIGVIALSQEINDRGWLLWEW